jgi:hypothetical protein
VSTGRTKQQREAIKAMQRQGKKVEVEVPKTSKDLSMSDRAPFALFEYSVRQADSLLGYHQANNIDFVGGASDDAVQFRYGLGNVQLLPKDQ